MTHMYDMRVDILTRPILFAASAMLAACAAPAPDGPDRSLPDTPVLSCAELAEQRAAEQYESDMARQDARESGLFQDDGLARDFAAADAEARRVAVEEDCERLRATPAESRPPAENRQ